MKKIALVLMCSLILTSCDIEDDGVNIQQVLAEVTDTDLPESFELGEVYEVDVTYLLPDACHIPMGLQVSRGGYEGAARRNIYVAGVAGYANGDNECTEEDEDLEKTNSFSIMIDENQSFTFYLWTGLDEDGKNVFTQVVVPVESVDTPTASE